jgi:hypothetical protein
MRKRIKLRKSFGSRKRGYIDTMESLRKEVGDVSGCIYLHMSDGDLEMLPAEDENGLCFYEVGNVLLGRDSLIRFVKNWRVYGKRR